MNEVPEALRAERRWICWKTDRDGKKQPRGADGKPLAGWREPGAWTSFSDAVAAAERNQLDGVGFVLGDGWGGIDLDDCRSPETGDLDPRAEAVVLHCSGAYTEVSPSGKGLKVFGRGDGWLELTFTPSGVKVQRKSPLYFAVTGRPYGDGRSALTELPYDSVAALFGASASRQPQRLPEVVVPGTQNTTMFREMGAMRRRGYSAETITEAVWAMVEGGTFPAAEGGEKWRRSDVSEMAARVCSRYPAGNQDFSRDPDGKVHANSTENVRKALAAMGVAPRRNLFSCQTEVDRDGVVEDLSDRVFRRLWFGCEEQFGWKPSQALLRDVLHDAAEQRGYHPVRDYLDSLEWDGCERVRAWLSLYAGAEVSDYVRAVGQLFLVAAVRRVRKPGSKFDELLVLESGQGLNKSNLIRALCPNPEWFSESIALGDDAKQVIERTSGIWIAEAAEIVGSKREVDRLKSFLSTTVDGPVRLAYAREPVKVPRQFVLVGTTNHAEYLRDSTGGRRFWPVKVGAIDVAQVEADRDQLWAEAAHLEKLGASTRLNPSLWAAAAREQEDRRVADAWEDALHDALGDRDGRVLARDVWGILGVDLERRDQAQCERLGSAMRTLGFRKTAAKINKIAVRAWERGRLSPSPWIQVPKGAEDL